MELIKGRICQLYLAFATSYGQLVLSLLMVWPSYTCPLFYSKDTPLSEPMTTSEEALIGALPFLGAVLGTAVTGTLIDWLGRKYGAVVLSLPFSISWVMVGSTSSMSVVLVARFLGGISGGGSLVYAPIYISEIAEDSFRGTLASALTLNYCLGMLLSYIFGWFFSYQDIIYINLGFGIACTVMMAIAKESPVYLLKRRKFEQAREALAHYRGCSPSSVTLQDEFSKLKQQILPAVELLSMSPENPDEAEQAKLNTVNDEGTEEKKISAVKLLFTTRSSSRAFWVVFFVMSAQVCMGIAPVQVYAESVFRETDPDHTDLYSVIFALVLTAGSFVTAVFSDRFGRRMLMISSSIFTCIYLIILGTLLQYQLGPPWLTIVVIMCYCFFFMYGASSVPYLLLAEVFVLEILIISSSVVVCVFIIILGYLLQEKTGPAWLTMLVIMVYCFFFTYGACSVPYLLLSEVFDSEVQNLASMLIIESVWLFHFIAIGLFPYTVSWFGLHGTFYSFAGVAAANGVFSYFLLPETKGLSIDRIQDIFSGKR